MTWSGRGASNMQGRCVIARHCSSALPGGGLTSSNLELLESSYPASMRAAIGYKKQGGEFLEASKAEVHVACGRLTQ
eukprot:2509271-Pyramimonas_sp.AAC.1